MNRLGNNAGNVVGTFLIAVLILVCLAAFSPTLRVLGSLTIAPWSDATPYVSGIWNGIGGAISKTLPQITAPAALPAPAPAAPAAPAPVTVIRQYPEKDPTDGCDYWVRSLSDGTFPKTLVSCPAAKPAPAAPAAPAPAPVAPAAAPAAPVAAAVSCNSQRETHAATAGQGWTPNGSWRIVNFWTNEHGHLQGERKLLLAPGQNPTLMGGGTSWSWGSTCKSTVDSEFAGNGLTAVDLAQLQAEGLAR